MRALGIVGLLCLALCVVGASQVQFVEQWRSSMPPVVVEEPRSDIKVSDVTLVSMHGVPLQAGQLLVAAFDRQTGDCLWLAPDRPRSSGRKVVVGHSVSKGRMWIVFNNGYYALSMGYPAVIVDSVTGEVLKELPEFSSGFRVEYSSDMIVTDDIVGVLEMGNSDRYTFYNRQGVRARLQLYDAESLELIGSMPINSTIPEHLRGLLTGFPQDIFTMGGYALKIQDNILHAMEFYHPYVRAPNVSGAHHRGQPHMVFDLGDNYFLTWWKYYEPEIRYGGQDHNRQTVSIHRWIPGQSLRQVWLADGKFGIRDLAGVWVDGRFWTPAEGNKIVFFNRAGRRVFTLRNVWAGAGYYDDYRPVYIHPSTKELLVSRHDQTEGTRYHLLSMSGRMRAISFPNNHKAPLAHEDGLLLLNHVGEDEIELVFGHLK